MGKFHNYNELLFSEFGYDYETQSHRISDTWPFTYHFLGRYDIDGIPTEVFKFKDGEEEFYLIDGLYLSVYKKSGLINAHTPGETETYTPN